MGAACNRTPPSPCRTVRPPPVSVDETSHEDQPRLPSTTPTLPRGTRQPEPTFTTTTQTAQKESEYLRKIGESDVGTGRRLCERC
jgi:hypothetical protein